MRKVWNKRLAHDENKAHEEKENVTKWNDKVLFFFFFFVLYIFFKNSKFANDLTNSYRDFTNDFSMV